MVEDYPTQLRSNLKKLTDDFKLIWERDFESKIEHYKRRLEEKGAFDIVYFIYSIPEISELNSYNDLRTLVEAQIRHGSQDAFYHLTSDAFLDYLLVSVTNNEISYDNLFSTEGFETAYQLLLEDTTFESKTSHGIALLSGIALSCQIVEISDKIRIRRASRFEIDYFKKFQQGFFLPSFAADPFDYHKVNSIFFLEFQSNEPFIIDDDEIQFMRKFGENFRRKYDLKSGPEIPEDYMEGFSTNIADDIIHNFLSCFRLLWGYNVRLYWIQYRSKRFIKPNNTYTSWKTGIVKHEFLAFQSSRIKDSINLKTEEVVQLVEFWDVFKQFSESIDQTTLKYFAKALVRFNRSFTENDLEDAIIDLAICLEIITSGAKGLTSFLIAPFVASNEDVENVGREIADFDRIRNEIVHGSVSSVEKIDLNKWTLVGGKIASACLRNFIFYVTNLPNQELPKGKRGIRDTLDACRVSISKQTWLQEIVPPWSMIRSTT